VDLGNTDDDHYSVSDLNYDYDTFPYDEAFHCALELMLSTVRFAEQSFVILMFLLPLMFLLSTIHLLMSHQKSLLVILHRLEFRLLEEALLIIFRFPRYTDLCNRW